MIAPFVFNPIGYIRSPLCKNGSPRQGSLAGSVRGVLRVSSGTGNNEEHALEGLEGFSHVWLIFVFHKNRGADILRNKVRPPKIDGKKGLFATRTPHRPNPIGLTLARLDRVDGCVLHLSQHDLIDGTPVLDVKPYLEPYDSVHPPLSSRMPPWIPRPDQTQVVQFTLHWSEDARKQLQEIPLNFYGRHELQLVKDTLTELMSLNPRSKYWAATYGDYYYLKFDRIVLHMTFKSDNEAIVDRIVIEEELQKF